MLPPEFYRLSNESMKQKYSIRDGRVFTEDNVLVFKVHVYKIPDKAQPEDVKLYFGRFGPVREICMCLSTQHRKRKCGVIQFGDPLAAARVLEIRKHFLHDIRIFVRPCESWEQPMQSDAPPMTAEQKKLPSLMVLNDYCLLGICDFLSLKDRINFSRVSKRCQEVFAWHCKQNIKCLDVAQVVDIRGLTLWDIRDFFMAAGPNLEHVYGYLAHRDNYYIVYFIAEYCKRLEKLQISYFNVSTSLILKLLHKLRDTIKDLDISSTDFEDNNIMESLKQLTHLETLNMTYCSNITGRHLHKLSHTKVQSLIMLCCYGLRSDYFSRSITRLKNIQYLDIRHCSELDTSVYRTLAKHCHQLKTLKISCDHEGANYEIVADIPKLEDLEIQYIDQTPQLPELILRALSEKRQNTLKKLSITGAKSISNSQIQLLAPLRELHTLEIVRNREIKDAGLREFCKLPNLQVLKLPFCANIHPAGFRGFISNCPKLNLINIENCYQFDNSTIDFILMELRERERILHRQGAKPPEERFKVVANYTNISTQYLKFSDIYEEVMATMDIECADYVSLSSVDRYSAVYVMRNNVVYDSEGEDDHF